MVTRAGFTLIEVIVALTLLSLGVLGLAASAGFAAALLGSAQRQEAATTLAASLLDSLVHVPGTGGGELTRGPLHAEWSTAGGLITLTVTYPDVRGPARRQWQALGLSALDALPTLTPPAR